MDSPSQRASNMKSYSVSWHHHEINQYYQRCMVWFCPTFFSHNAMLTGYRWYLTLTHWGLVVCQYIYIYIYMHFLNSSAFFMHQVIPSANSDVLSGRPLYTKLQWKLNQNTKSAFEIVICILFRPQCVKDLVFQITSCESYHRHLFSGHCDLQSIKWA